MKLTMGRPNLSASAHQAKRLAVTFRMGETEIVADVLLGVVALLMADDHDPLVADLGKAADEGEVVAEAAVAAHFHEIVRDELEVIEGVGPRRMAHDLHPLPGREVRVDPFARFAQPLFQRFEFGHRVGGVFLGADFQRLDASSRVRPLPFQTRAGSISCWIKKDSVQPQAKDQAPRPRRK